MIYGMERSGIMDRYDVSLDIPSVCAKRLMTNDADIGLVPVAAIPHIRNARIVGKYGIGSRGAVDSVLLVGQVPVEEMENILLDHHSMTSVQLVQILARDHWKVNPSWMQASPGYESQIQGKTGGVVIGDRAFGIATRFRYVYDLSAHWMEMTGLPFVFAAWVSNTKPDESFEIEMEAALALGTGSIDAALEGIQHDHLSAIDMRNYLNKIVYRLDGDMLEGLRAFQTMAPTLHPR
ncbi:MAG: menaquinone biosynthesis protein [Flavobacteriales bacterium]|nr:menaquinone biosynthesis protein [Flavobacteriales bacterium]